MKNRAGRSLVAAKTWRELPTRLDVWRAAMPEYARAAAMLDTTPQVTLLLNTGGQTSPNGEHTIVTGWPLATGGDKLSFAALDTASRTAPTTPPSLAAPPAAPSVGLDASMSRFSTSINSISPYATPRRRMSAADPMTANAASRTAVHVNKDMARPATHSDRCGRVRASCAVTGMRSLTVVSTTSSGRATTLG